MDACGRAVRRLVLTATTEGSTLKELGSDFAAG